MSARESTGGALQIGGRPVSWIRDGDCAGRRTLIMAHGAAAPYTSHFMERSASELVERGLRVVRFHFPYMEQQVRNGKRRPPNTPRILLDTWQAILELVREESGHDGVAIGGKSMGGRIASMLLAAGRAPDVSAAVYLGYPLHPSGKPDKLRADHLSSVPVPQLFISGSKDPLCDLDRLRPVLEPIGDRAKLVVIEDGDHSLAVGRQDPFADAGAWLDEIVAFVSR